MILSHLVVPFQAEIHNPHHSMKMDLITPLLGVLCYSSVYSTEFETCIISYMKRITSPGSMHDTGCLGLVHWDDPEGWYGEGGGFRMGNTCILAVDSC